MQASFRARVHAALASEQLATALERALGSFRERRAAALPHDEFRQLQVEVRARRAAAIDRLPELVEQFTASARAVGAHVHLASTAAEACQIIGDLAAARGARLVVKSKSMATEEVGLNAALEARGVEVVETDLGEWILQLMGDHPSHLIAPAIHHTREEVAALLSRVVGEPLPADTATLVQVARRVLREKFVSADVGISGANLAIAESGTIVLVTNEGNGRLVTTLPPVHVALFGVDKLVATLDDALAVLKALPPSATGQRISTYVSFITGPSRSADIELTLATGVHGPGEVHYVLLDNGRWAMRDDPRFREALQCIRCAACANVCPSYQVVGGHVFGHIYTGPIGLMLTAFHHGLEHAAGPQSLCLGCNACETVCPAGIPLPRQIMDLRQMAVEKQGLPAPKALALRALADPPTLRRAAGLARLAARFAPGDVRFVRQAPFIGHLLRYRSLPRPPERALVERLAGSAEDGLARFAAAPVAALAAPAAGRTVGYFAGCITDWLYPRTGEQAVEVLRACGAAVVVPVGQSCCGLPALNAGDAATARRMARQTIVTLEATPAELIVSGAPSCVVAITQDYPRLLADEPQWRARAERLADGRVVDLTTFLTRHAPLPAGALAAGPCRRVTYHDACQSHNCLGLRAEPRYLIADVLGHELVEMADASVCCGFGGTFSFDYPEVAARILRRKLDHACATGAEIIAADNPGCLMHLRGGVDAERRPVRVAHVVELIAERLAMPGGA
ncbi:MAG: LUD domain-containing protein [Chloroflexi bacterium]|nr:LUD domain-containing protein [Chloroflexota bacterium]